MNPAIEGIVAAACRALSLLFLGRRRVSRAGLEPRDESRLEHFRYRDDGAHFKLFLITSKGLSKDIVNASLSLC